MSNTTFASQLLQIHPTFNKCFKYIHKNWSLRSKCCSHSTNILSIGATWELFSGLNEPGESYEHSNLLCTKKCSAKQTRGSLGVIRTKTTKTKFTGPGLDPGPNCDLRRHFFPGLVVVELRLFELACFRNREFRLVAAENSARESLAC